jgi:hypothetical protein
MDIWIPEKKIQPAYSNPHISVGFRGEYRAILEDEKGRIKYDSGWQPNFLIHPGNGINYGLQYMGLGDSSTAPADAQTGIQGTQLGNSVSVDVYPPAYSQSYTVLGVPSYGWNQSSAVFPPGNGTGTIREVVVGGSNASTQAAVRFIPSSPIVKGASDQLTMEYKIWLYPNTTVETGTTLINGTSYDWKMGYFRMGFLYYGDLWGGLISRFTVGPRGSGSGIDISSYTGGSDPVDADSNVTGTKNSGTGTGWLNTSSGILSNIVDSGAGTRTVRVYADPDSFNVTFSHLEIAMAGNLTNVGGLWLSLLRTSDSAEFTKENTHRFEMEYEVSLVRHVP